ncbi:MAG: type II secretion system protein [Methylococcales bacterium]|nr:MAG: type II secretion system protein [Methylococcales bacterium]
MPNNKQQGFSLLEILIAFSILALSLGILLKIFSAGVNTAIIAENYTTAVQISESLMAKTGIETPLQIGQTTGIENNIYHWQIEISPFTFNDDQIDTKILPAELFKVKISVHWGDDMLSDRQLELTTLKLLNKSI